MRLLIGLGFTALAIGAGAQGFHMVTFAISPLRSQSKEATILEVRKGEGPNEIAKALQAAQAIEDPQSFVRLGRLLRQWGRIKAGEYRVSPALTPIELFSAITSGISVAHPVTVREGENMYEISADMEQKGLLKSAHMLELCRSPQFMASAGLSAPLPPSLEGYLYPDTYFFNRTLSAEDMIRQMVRHHLQLWAPQYDERAKTLGLTRLQALTLASMIEKETGAPRERKLISSVFHNRLRKRMKLQSDPTTIYGIWEKYRGNLHKSDLLAASPYNTYSIPALPIGPISNPGKEAIEAALFPETSEFLFFVSRNDGTHEFTRSYEDHNAAVRRFQLDPKARAGKSWRDLSKQAEQH